MRIVNYQKCVAFLRAACLLSCLSHHAPAQQQQQQPPPQPALSLQAQKFDEFGDVPASDIAARLDNFANELQANPNAKGFIITYRSRRDLPGLSGRLMNLLRGYLIKSRQIDPKRIAGVDGGEALCVSQELWIVPPGAAPIPRPDAYKLDYEDVESIRKFDEASFGEGGSSYHNSVDDSLEGYADALRREPRATAYIIAYAQYAVIHWRDEDERGRKNTRRQVMLDPPGTAARELRRIKSLLVRKHGITAARIKLMDGGHRRDDQAELWIVPRARRAPIATPDTFPKRRG